MSRAATNRERSPLHESSDPHKDTDCYSVSTSSSRRSPSPIVHLIEASLDSSNRKRVPVDALRSSKPTKTSHRNFTARTRGGRSNVDLTENDESLGLLLNGRQMELLLRKNKGRMNQTPRHPHAPRRSLRYLEEERAEVTSSTPRTLDGKGKRQEEEPNPVEEVGQKQGHEISQQMEVEQWGQWVTSSEAPVANRSVLGGRPAELLEQMDYHVADNCNFASTLPITNVTSHMNIAGYRPFMGDFYGSPFTAPPPVVSSYNDTHYRRPRKPQIEKPVVEYGRTGTVANYNCSEGYGFITVKSVMNKLPITGNMFVHHSGLQVPSLTKGVEVKFDVAQGERGYEAINVSLLG